MKSQILNLLLPITISVLVISSVFFSEKIIPIIVGFLILLFFFENRKKENFLNSLQFLMPYIIYICVYIMYTFFSEDLDQGLKLLERQILIIILPIIIFSSNFNKKRVAVFAKTFIFLMLMVGVVALYKLIYFLIDYQEWISFMNSKKGDFTYVQFKFPHLMSVHPTYWGYLLVITNILILNNNVLELFKNIKVVQILFIIFNINLFYLSARTPILISVIIYTIVFIFHFRKKTKSRKKLYRYAAFVLFIFFFFLFQPLMFFKLTNIYNDERFYLWPKAYEVIKSNYFILGEGLGAGNKILKEYLFDVLDNRNNYSGIDLHNQYLKVYLDMGILGFVSLIYLIIYPGLICLRNKKCIILNISFSTLFLFCIMTESTLYVIKGIVIFAVFSSIFIKTVIESNDNYLPSISEGPTPLN